MNKHIKVSRRVGYPKVRLNSVSQVFILSYIMYDREYFHTLGIIPDESYRYIDEYDSYTRQELRSYQSYQLTII